MMLFIYRNYFLISRGHDVKLASLHFLENVLKICLWIYSRNTIAVDTPIT